MKYYTRIGKHKDRSKQPIYENYTYEEAPSCRFHLRWVLAVLGVLVIILAEQFFVKHSITT